MAAARRTWTDDQLKEAVANSLTMMEVIRRLGLKFSGGNMVHVRNCAVELGFDMSHFVGQRRNKGSRKPPKEVAADLLPLLRRGVFVRGLRNRLIASEIKKAECEGCGITEWQGVPAPLQVDHVDGDRLNNEITNLRILCANCHMLTDTWGFKNGRRRPQALVA